MACSKTYGGRSLPCKDRLGGVKNIWFGDWSDGIWPAISSGAVADASSSLSVYSYEPAKNSGSFTQTITSSVENGTVYFEQVLEFVLPAYQDAGENDVITDLAQGRHAVVVEDMNGNRFVMGHSNGVECTGGAVETGAAPGDVAGMRFTMTAQEIAPAPTGPTVDGSNLVFDPTPL